MAKEPDAAELETATELVALWLDRAIQVQGSDLHFEPDGGGLAIKMRIDGLLHLVKRVNTELGRQIIYRLMIMASLHTHHKKKPQEGRADFTSERTDGTRINLRISTFPTVWGTRAVVRFFHGLERIPQLKQLGYAKQVVEMLGKFACQTQGMVLLAGPAGSGKTTTVYSLLHHIKNIRPGCSIISIEDPVEYSIEGITQVQIGQYVGGLTYKEALKSLLRQDPQVMAIGEIRDPDTAAICLEATLTGHLLISTIHSPNIAGVIIRLLDLGLPPYQLASALAGVISQRLVRRLCPHCKKRSKKPEEPFTAGKCAKCFKTGYRGRVPVAEAAYITHDVRQAIMGGTDVRVIQDALRTSGFPSLKEDARRILRAGDTTESQVLEMLHTLE